MKNAILPSRVDICHAWSIVHDLAHGVALVLSKTAQRTLTDWEAHEPKILMVIFLTEEQRSMWMLSSLMAQQMRVTSMSKNSSTADCQL